MLKLMAIFGDLEKMSPPEVLKLLGNRTGKLHLWPDPQKQFELHMHEGTVYCLKEDGISVGDKVTLQKRLSELSSVRQGKFDFSPETLALLTHEFNFTRQELLQLLAEAELAPETDAEPLATDKETRFKLSGASYDELPENLQAFLQHADGLLMTGSSAAELAEVLELHVPLVQLYLMRLRSLGKVAPVRAYAPSYAGYNSVPEDAPKDTTAEVRPSSAPFQPEVTPASPSLPPETLQQPATQGPLPAQGVAVQEVIAQQFTPRRNTAQPAPTQHSQPGLSFVRHLLSVLTFGGR